MFCFAVIACVARASRQEKVVTGLLAIARRRVGGDTAAGGAAVGRGEFTVRKEKRPKPSNEPDRKRGLVHDLEQEAAPPTETSTEHVIDHLTGLPDRRAHDDVLAGEVDSAKRCDSDLGLVLIDLDDFKTLNDTYGYPQGDVVLREVARVLRHASCEIDHPARYGGEEFAVILRGADLGGASSRGERICEQIAQLRIARLDGQGTVRATASYGAASARGARADANALLTAANRALYEAKRRPPDDDPDGGVREPRRPAPDRGADGVARRPPDAAHASEDPNRPDVR